MLANSFFALVMFISSQNSQTFLNVTFYANGESTKQVGTLKYLDFTITWDARTDAMQK